MTRNPAFAFTPETVPLIAPVLLLNERPPNKTGVIAKESHAPPPFAIDWEKATVVVQTAGLVT